MSFSIIIGLSLLITFRGVSYGGDNVEEPSLASLFMKYACCSRIEYQTKILKGVSSATEKLTKDVEKIKTGVEDDIPSELKRQAVDLEKLSSELKSELKKQAVGHEELSAELKRQGVGQGELSAELKSELTRQAVDLKGVKTTVGEISVSLSKHTEDLVAHDARMKELGLLLEKMNKVINGIHGTLTGAKDCSDIRALGHSTSGVYRVYPGSLAGRIQTDVYCDLTTPGGNWLVFQRRKDGSFNFERTWIEYKDGFGNPSGEFWLGNEALYLLTSNGKYKLRIDMEDFDGQKRYAEYSSFSISSSADKYRLTASGYTGNAGDNFSGHNGMQFSTKDEDNDTYDGNCAKQFRGAWWYSACHASNLNGAYLRGPHKTHADGVEWHAFRGHYYSLKMTEMKIAAVN
jgi:ficolin